MSCSISDSETDHAFEHEPARLRARLTIGGTIHVKKSELIARLAGRRTPFATKDAEHAVRTILERIARALGSGDRVEIRSFGVFDLSYRSARVARNPRSGATVHVPEHYVPAFKAGKQLRERVDPGLTRAERGATPVPSISARRPPAQSLGIQ